MLIPITEAMRAQAIRVGTARQRWHDDHCSHDRYGATGGVTANINGALGEIVAATMFGVLDQWVEVCDDFKELSGDIAPGIQIRTTTHPTGRLLTHPSDRDGDVFGLVRLFTNVADVVGWIRGADTKRPEWWIEPVGLRPCYATPTNRLTHVSVRLRVLV